MDEIRQYLLSVTVAAVICGIVTAFFGKKSALNGILKLLCGLFLVVTAIQPLASIRLQDLGEYLDSIQLQSDDISLQGQSQAEDALRTIIKERVQSYILDKANSLGLSVSVEVVLDEQTPPAPCAVTITGAASPYAKAALSRYISQELAIGEEHQTWN